jgi:multidrug efflux pump subunit AcrA (membrane-fusion protein)
MSATHDQRMTETKSQVSVRRTASSALDQSGQERVLRTHSEDAPSKHPWRRLFSVASVLFAIATYAAVNQPWQTLSAQKAVDSEHHAEESAKAVTIVNPAPAANSDVVLPASFRPWQAASLHARVSGYLAAWHRDLGAEVKAGDLLAEIETPELDQELAEGEALAKEAVAAAAQARAEHHEAEAELKVAEAQLGRAQAELALAQSQHQRREVLIQNRAISQEEYDTYQRQLEARAADVAAAQSDVARRRANLTTRAAVITVREATANSRQANVDRLQELQRFKRIVAPFSGVISSRSAEVGMLVTAGKEPLFVVEDLSRIRVHVSVPQTYSMQTRRGTFATVILPESGLAPVAGEITRTAESVDPASRTMLAEIELDNAEHRFQPGSYSQVQLALSQGDGWTIPTNTLSMRVDGPHVAVVDDGFHVELKRVTLGRDLGKGIIVTAGIQGSERLVVNPGDDLASGDRVKVTGSGGPIPRLAQR